VESLMEGG